MSHHASTTYSFITLFGGGDLLTFGMLAMVGVNHVNVFFFAYFCECFTLVQDIQVLHSQEECRLKLEQQFSKS